MAAIISNNFAFINDATESAVTQPFRVQIIWSMNSDNVKDLQLLQLLLSRLLHADKSNIE